MTVKLLIILSLALKTISMKPNCHEGQFRINCRRYELKSDEAFKMNVSGTDTLSFYESTGSIGRKTFSSIPSVEELRILESNITEIEEGALCSIPGLQKINLEGGEVFPVITESVLNNCQNLKFLTVANVELRPTAFKHLTNLESLSLEQLKIPHLTREYFDEMKNLRTLRLFKTNIDNIDPNVLCLSPKFKEIILQYNHQTPDKSWFGNCDSLEALTMSLSFTDYVDLEDDIFNNLINLRSLDADHLNITQLTKTHLKGLTQLESLALMANIRAIDSDAFSDLTSLRELILRANQLRELNPSAFGKLEKLTEADLGRNNLTGFGNLILPEIKTLDVDDNSIGTIDVNTLHSNFPKLSSLSIKDNPMDCPYKEQLFQDLMKVGVRLNTKGILGDTPDDCNYPYE